MTFNAKEDEQERFLAAGFIPCEFGVFGQAGGYFEWPSCWHKGHPKGRRVS